MDRVLFLVRKYGGFLKQEMQKTQDRSTFFTPIFYLENGAAGED